ncbi:S26 family signal peptidase [Haloarchaeobius amylolyticus]|uniref:S26 family signal peptidase n=1 Tax=Haloarchaeobius amylolyticus TaxID=1198296 RepID=A0ABD6BKL1_9EURY
MDGPDVSERSRNRSGPRDDAESEMDPASDRSRHQRTAASRATTSRGDGVTIDDGLVRWLLETDDRMGTTIRDLATIIAIIAIAGSLLFGVSGTWPPLVAVESGSMDPHIEQGDLVFVVDSGRFVGDGAVAGTDVVTAQRGHARGYAKFDNPGDVVIFLPNGDPTKTPTIHRAQFWVDEGERWVETKADPAYMHGVTCAEIASCPAPHDGFITKGDANPAYDQVPQSGAETTVVSDEWIIGKALVRVPWIGQVRLAIDSVRSVVGTGPIVVATVGSVIALIWYGSAADTHDR